MNLIESKACQNMPAINDVSPEVPKSACLLSLPTNLHIYQVLQWWMQYQALLDLCHNLQPAMTLTVMSSTDNPQTFVELFECVAAACQWPQEEWALLPLLLGKAQLATQQLLAYMPLKSQTMKKVVVQQVSRTPEEY